MEQDIRWKQRYQNYLKALQQLSEFIEQETLNKFEVQGLIQCFEYTFELAWKTMKDYLESEGFNVNTPREAIQTSYKASLIADGHIWIDALQKRNLMSHTYNEDTAKEAENLIKNTYFVMLKELKELLDRKV